MRFGYAPIFQNCSGARLDRDVWRDELDLILLALECGYDSVWATEHHFTDFEMSPSPLQLLSWVCGRAPGIEIGTMVIVLPWHDPVRIAEEITVLDHLAGGRFTLGIGRGLSEAEYAGMRVPMSESLERFEEVAGIVVSALASGRFEQHAGTHYDLSARDVRPAPFRPLTGRVYGAPSVASVDMMARLGSGLLLVPRRSFQDNVRLAADHAAAWTRTWPGVPVPGPILNQFICVHEDSSIAHTSAQRHLAAFDREEQRHHGRARSTPRAGSSADPELTDFIARAAWGTPDQVIEKLAADVRRFRPRAILTHASYGGMPREDAERSIRLFTRHVMPALSADVSIGDLEA